MVDQTLTSLRLRLVLDTVLKLLCVPNAFRQNLKHLRLHSSPCPCACGCARTGSPESGKGKIRQEAKK